MDDSMKRKANENPKKSTKKSQLIPREEPREEWRGIKTLLEQCYAFNNSKSNKV